MRKYSFSKEKLENYTKKRIISSSIKMKSPLNASKKTDYLCWFLEKSKKHLKYKLKSSNRS